jgi:uncharacterized membrane protein YhiD involved in acid resistance
MQGILEFLQTTGDQVILRELVINLLLSALLAFILGHVYVKYGSALSNRKMFAGNFIPLAMTTTLIISIIKTSIALSLGLVGALSIVRFRAAIKEPEELTFLFVTIAIGLGLGANQPLITVTAFAIIVTVVYFKNMTSRPEENQNLFLTVTCSAPREVKLEQIVESLKRHCPGIRLKRFDESSELLEASFLIDFDNFDQLNRSKSELQGLSDSIKITFLDNKGI